MNTNERGDRVNGPLYIGIDSSTQSTTAIVLDRNRDDVIARESVVYDDDLPQWGTRGGQLEARDRRVGHAPPLLWIDALEEVTRRLADSVDLGSVGAIAVAAQQHGTVYLNEAAPKRLARLADLDPGEPLRSGLESVLARQVSPIWTDSSTTEECAEIRAALGGIAAAARLTGSDVFERFVAPQVRRFWKQSPEDWQATRHLLMVSSFITSVLAGRVAPIDYGDASGTNLLDIRKHDWSNEALDASAPDLRQKLLAPASPETIIGPINPWFARTFGLGADTLVAIGTGDNPSSAQGVGLAEPGDAALSLGTSDTLFALAEEPRVDVEGRSHVFIAATGHPMNLFCVRNGGLVRELVRDLNGLDWQGFADAIDTAPPGSNGSLVLPWREPEILPRLASPLFGARGDIDLQEPAACRALVEAQMLSLRIHAQQLGIQPTTLRLTGGSSTSAAIAQLVADVFSCPVERIGSADSAALGAALRAAGAVAADEPESQAAVRTWQAACTKPEMRTEPRLETAPLYESLALCLREEIGSMN